MLDALIAGERDADVLAELALGRMRPKRVALRRALAAARFRPHHAVMLSEHLGHLDHLDGGINRLDDQIDRLMAPFSAQRDKLATIPGVGKRAAEVIIAEIAVDMSVFPTAGHLASWAGMCPGNNESAGEHLSGRTRQGDPWLAGLLTECGWAARGARDTYLSARFGRSLAGAVSNERHWLLVTRFSSSRGTSCTTTPSTGTSVPTGSAEKMLRPSSVG